MKQYCKISSLSQSGFTLIEMMMAMAIVAIAMAAAISLTASIGLNTARLEEKAHAQWLLANAFVQIRLQQFEKFNPTPLGSSITTEMGGRDWHVFSQSENSEFRDSSVTTIQICTDLLREDCVLQQDIFSSARKINAN